jgi:hypothetical protein
MIIKCLDYPLQIIFANWTEQIISTFFECCVPIHSQEGALKITPADENHSKTSQDFEVCKSFKLYLFQQVRCLSHEIC